MTEPDNFKQFPNAFRGDHDVYLKNESGEISPAFRYTDGEYIQMASVPAQAPPVDPGIPGEWDDVLWKPEDYANVEEVSSGLANFLRAYDGEKSDLLAVVSDDAAIELEQILWDGGVGLASGVTITAKPEEFLSHTIRMRSGTSFEPYGSISLQGFKFGGGSYGAKISGKGSFSFAHSEFSGGVKGIAVTGGSADAVVWVYRSHFHDIRDSVSAGVYNVRGHTYIDECVFERIGMLDENQRSGNSILNHGNYSQWDCKTNIINSYFRDMDSHAAQLRGGGTILNCAAIETANGFLIGHGESDRPNVAGRIQDCIVSDTEDVSESKNTGVGIWAHRSDIAIVDTYILNERSRGLGSAIRPKENSNVSCQRVFVQGCERVVDVDGPGVKVEGLVKYSGPVTDGMVNTNRPGGDSSDLSGLTFIYEGARQLPDFRSMPAPKPGEVAQWMDNARGMIR